MTTTWTRRLLVLLLPSLLWAPTALANGSLVALLLRMHHPSPALLEDARLRSNGRLFARQTVHGYDLERQQSAGLTGAYQLLDRLGRDDGTLHGQQNARGAIAIVAAARAHPLLAVFAALQRDQYAPAVAKVDAELAGFRTELARLETRENELIGRLPTPQANGVEDIGQKTAEIQERQELAGNLRRQRTIYQTVHGKDVVARGALSTLVNHLSQSVTAADQLVTQSTRDLESLVKAALSDNPDQAALRSMTHSAITAALTAKGVSSQQASLAAQLLTAAQ